MLAEAGKTGSVTRSYGRTPRIAGRTRKNRMWGAASALNGRGEARAEELAEGMIATPETASGDDAADAMLYQRPNA